jgi:hypothetical protein
MNIRIKITNARLAFPNLFEPGEFGQRSATFILGEKDALAVQKAMKAIADAEFDGAMPSARTCLRKNASKSEYDGFEEEDGYHIYASRYEPFKSNQLIDRDKSPAKEDTFYSGCYVNAVISLWAQNNAFGKNFNAEIVGVQFYQDGDYTGRSPFDIEDDDFEALPPLKGTRPAPARADVYILGSPRPPEGNNRAPHRPDPDPDIDRGTKRTSCGSAPTTLAFGAALASAFLS